jgi:hypothetical protein
MAASNAVPLVSRIRSTAELPNPILIKGCAMKKTIPSLILVAAVSAFAVPAAYAYDSDVRSDWNDIRRDRDQIAADARKV